MSLPEVLLWDCLRGQRLGGLRFRRQHAIEPYVLDFYCPAAKLAVEVDGAHHDLPGQLSHDERRDRWLDERGVRVMRIAAADILDDQAFEGVLRMIADAARSPPI
jgi:very-short-patch-repair endonuclease